MGQQYPYSKIWVKNIVVILHNYGARGILLIFCDLPDTESESCEIRMSIYQAIFNHKNISKALWDNYIHTLQYRRKTVVVLHIYGTLFIFLLFFYHQDTESE